MVSILSILPAVYDRTAQINMHYLSVDQNNPDNDHNSIQSVIDWLKNYRNGIMQ
jgi:hypothetical protein